MQDREREFAETHDGLDVKADTLAQFDDLETTPIGSILTSAPVINGIDFSDAIVAEPGPSLEAASGSNAIGFGLPNSLLNGDLTVYPGGTFYAVGKVKAFDLTSVRYGCYLTRAGVPGVIQTLGTTPCTVSVSGYTTEGKVVSENTFSFAPESLTGATMGLKEFGSLKRLTNVTFEVLNAGLLPAAVAVLALDDVNVCRYK